MLVMLIQNKIYLFITLLPGIFDKICEPFQRGLKFLVRFKDIHFMRQIAFSEPLKGI